MKEKIERRLQELKGEYESGQRMLADLDVQRTNLQQTIWRISGAIQVLEELLTAEAPTAGDSAVGSHSSQLDPQLNLERESGQ
jgi:hypothetical protein